MLDAIKKVRLDTDPTDWAVVGHFQDDPNKIELVASGTNGYDGMINTLQEDKVMYAILRVSTTVDLSITIKFVYIHLIGRKVGFAKRGKFSVVHGSVKKLFMPFHVEFEVEGLDEVPLKDITEKVEKAAGNADFVRSGAFAGTRPEYGKHMNQKEIDNLIGNHIILTPITVEKMGDIKEVETISGKKLKVQPGAQNIGGGIYMLNQIFTKQGSVVLMSKIIEN